MRPGEILFHRHLLRQQERETERIQPDARGRAESLEGGCVADTVGVPHRVVLTGSPGDSEAYVRDGAEFVPTLLLTGRTVGAVPQ